MFLSLSDIEVNLLRSSSEGLKQVITRSCFTAVVLVTALNEPCFLSIEDTFDTTNPTPCKAF